MKRFYILECWLSPTVSTPQHHVEYQKRILPSAYCVDSLRELLSERDDD